MLQAAVAAFVLLPAGLLPAEDLDVARVALARYETQVTCIEGTYIQERVTPVPEDDDHYQEWSKTCDFTIDFATGNFRRETIRTWKKYGISRTKPFQLRYLDARDGDSAVNLSYTFAKVPVPTQVPADVPDMLVLSARPDMTSPAPWHAGPWKVQGQSLADLLGRGDASFDGMEAVDGHSCWRVKLEESEQTLWLDPQAGFLPRRREYRTEGRVTREETALEFKLFADPDHAAQRPFPTRWRVRHHWPKGTPTDEVFTVTKLSLNPKVPAERYRIDESKLPPGVYVQQADRSVRYTGDAKGVYDERYRQKAATDRKLEELLPIQTIAPVAPPPPRPKVPEPDPWDNVRLWAVGIAALVLLVVAPNRRRRA